MLISLRRKLLEEVEAEMTALEDSFKTSFPPELKLVKTLKLRYTQEGKLYKNIVDAMSEYPEVKINATTEEVEVYNWVDFNPGSPKERIDVLWDAGWKPFEKTKGHKKKLMEMRRNSYG